MPPTWFFLILGLILALDLEKADGDDVWFQAASYVMTQEALDEAPYRYAKFLDDALRKIEAKEFPYFSNGDACGSLFHPALRYRVGTAGQGSRLRIVDNSLKVTTRKPNSAAAFFRLRRGISVPITVTLVFSSLFT
jgi:hypothetical protein